MSPARGRGGKTGGGGRGGRSGAAGRGGAGGKSSGGGRGTGRGSSSRAGSTRDGGPGGKGGAKATGSSRGTSTSSGGAPGGGRRSAPRGLGGEQVEGRQAVRELLLAGRRKVLEVWIGSDDDDVALDDLAELANDVGVPVRPVSRSRLAAEARTEAPQGVVAKARPLPEIPLEDLVRVPKGAPAPFLLALDGVTDPGNLGALLRSAECAGVTGVVLPRHRAVHVTPTVTKAAAGAVEYLPMSIVGGLPTAITQLQQTGVTVVGLDMAGPVSLFDLPLGGDDPVCLVLGAEGAGLSRLVRQRCDVVAAIPLGGRLGSLNVSVAGALACFEVVRRRSARPGPG